MDFDDARVSTDLINVRQRLLTVDEYHRMGEAGILTRGERVELIDGRILKMQAIGSPHFAAVTSLTRLLVFAVVDRGIVTVQNPIRLDARNEPEPDLMVLRSRDDVYHSALPRPGDAFLLVEVADTSLEFDRAVKRPLYARHGIPELWIVDVNASVVEVCRDPVGDEYAAITTVGRGETLGIPKLPGAIIDVSRIFPPLPSS
jgi:Uma2 family endonuclease